MAAQPIDDALKVHAADGMVMIDDGNGCVVTLTPAAAMATSDTLMDVAAQAVGQAKQSSSR